MTRSASIGARLVAALRCIPLVPSSSRPVDTPVTPDGVGSEVTGEPIPDTPQEVPMSDPIDPGLCSGEYSYHANAVRMGPSGGSADTSTMFPEGWSSPGDTETRTSTIRENAERGLWLPLFIPDGCEGHKGDVDPETGDVLPDMIFYAADHIASDFDQRYGEIHTSPEQDEARYQNAVDLALEAASMTAGAPHLVQENA